MYFPCNSPQINVSEIDFADRYKCAEDLADDENRDLYPPRFITQLCCHQQSRPALDVKYKLHIRNDGKVVKNYNFSIVVAKASHEGNSSCNGFSCAHVVALKANNHNKISMVQSFGCSYCHLQC